MALCNTHFPAPCHPRHTGTAATNQELLSEWLPAAVCSWLCIPGGSLVTSFLLCHLGRISAILRRVTLNIIWPLVVCHLCDFGQGAASLDHIDGAHFFGWPGFQALRGLRCFTHVGLLLLPLVMCPLPCPRGSRSQGHRAFLRQPELLLATFMGWSCSRETFSRGCEDAMVSAVPLLCSSLWRLQPPGQPAAACCWDPPPSPHASPCFH